MRSLLLVCVAVAFLQPSSAAGDCVNNTGHEGDFLLCVGRPKTVEVGKNTSFAVKMVEKNPNRFGEEEYYFVDSATLNVSLEHSHLASLSEDEFTLTVDSNLTIFLHSLEAGRSEIKFQCINDSNDSCPFNQSYLELVRREIAFAHSHPLNIIIAIVGWIYFAAWSISFYPQIFLNFYRRSVIGLNFDYLALNLTGFLAYAAFNVCLFWAPTIKVEYFVRHPAGVNPVLLNDVIFSLHAVAATLFTIGQCFFFKRGDQKVSYTAMVLLGIFWLTLIISLFVSVGGKLAWLDYLYVASYVKLAITLVKYVPQAWFNCRRRSTVGWSIGNVLLDFTGGTFSILQMFLLSYNYDDWKSIFGDPTKFGLGFFSIMFDLVFMVQHYILFRHPPREGGYQKIKGEEGDTDSLPTPTGYAEKKRGLVGRRGSIQDSDGEQKPLLREQLPKK